MELIAEVRRRESEDLQKRLAMFDETVLLMPHDGDLPVQEGFQFIRAHTVADICRAPVSTIVALSHDALEVAHCIQSYGEVIGINLVTVSDVPGQKPDEAIVGALGKLRNVSFTQILIDLADMKLIEDNMSKEELESSIAKKQRAQVATKSGDIRPLTDFDRAEEDELDVERDI